MYGRRPRCKGKESGVSAKRSGEAMYPALGSGLTGDIVEARQVPSRSIEARNKPELHGVIADNEQDWDFGSCSLSRESRQQPG